MTKNCIFANPVHFRLQSKNPDFRMLEKVHKHALRCKKYVYEIKSTLCTRLRHKMSVQNGCLFFEANLYSSSRHSVFGIVYNLFVSDHSCYLKYFKASFSENYVSSAFPSKFLIELRILLFQEMSNKDCIISLETDFPIFSSYIRNIKRLGSF